MIVALAAAGCGHGKIRDGTYYAPKARYRIAVPDRPWSRISVKGADLVLTDDDRGASILASTLCDRYAKTGLDILSRNLFIGFGERRVLEQEPVDLPGGKAERLQIEARLDGDRIRAEAYTLRRSPCIYDFVYLSIPDRFQEGLPVFRRMMQSLRFEKGDRE